MAPLVRTLLPNALHYHAPCYMVGTLDQDKNLNLGTEMLKKKRKATLVLGTYLKLDNLGRKESKDSQPRAQALTIVIEQPSNLSPKRHSPKVL